MLRAQQTILHARPQQRAALVQVAAFTAARVQSQRQVLVAVAPPGGACAAVEAAVEVSAAVPHADLEQQRAYLETLPTLPAPGTPEFEFSSDNFLQRFEMSEVLGEGTFGSVRRCVDTTTGQAYAVKVIPKRSVTDTKDRASFIAREVHMWRMLAALSPRVAALQGAYQDNNNIFLVQELLLDDMQKLLEQEGVVSEHEAATAMRCVLEALAALHAADVVYGDVKPANFVRTKHFPSLLHQIDSSQPRGDIDVKLIDFGTAQLCKDGCSVAEGISGTPVFLAPEVTIHNRCSISMDVWAAGAMLYLMVTGQYPLWDVPALSFKVQSMKLFRATIQAGAVFWDIPAVQALSPSCQDLLKKMLTADPAQRISAQEALEHPWLKEQLSGAKAQQH